MASTNSHSPRRSDSGVLPEPPVRLTSINFMGLTLGALMCEGHHATAVAYTNLSNPGARLLRPVTARVGPPLSGWLLPKIDWNEPTA